MFTKCKNTSTYSCSNNYSDEKCESMLSTQPYHIKTYIITKNNWKQLPKKHFLDKTYQKHEI